jgi:hypothetical protein
MKYIKLGRGARNQRDVFHQRYLDRKDQLREQYVLCRTHKEKRYIQETLIEWVKQTEGEFVEESPHDKRVLQVVTDHNKLLKKVAQALREVRKGPQTRHGSLSVPPTKHRRTTLARSKGSSSKPTPEVVALSKPDVLMPPLSEMIAQNMRVPRKASKAVYSTISNPSIELQPMEHTITDEWNTKENDFLFLQSHPLGFDFIDEKVMIIPDNVGSKVSDRQMGDKLGMDRMVDSVPESIELWDTLLFRDLSDDELWRHAKDLEDIFEF